MSRVIVSILFVGLTYYVYWYLASEDVIPPRPTFEEFPMEMSDWKCLGTQTMTEDVSSILGVTDYLMCNFREAKTANFVHLYLGYHEVQTRSSDGKDTAIHPPEHCLPGSGWDVIDATVVPVPYGGGGEAKRFVIAKGNQRNLVYFWYQSRGRVIARSHEKILYMFLDRATRGRTDGSLVRFTVPVLHGDINEAEATFDRFAATAAPIFSEFIPN